jgi:hypothetical protein
MEEEEEEEEEKKKKKKKKKCRIISFLYRLSAPNTKSHT